MFKKRDYNTILRNSLQESIHQSTNKNGFIFVVLILIHYNYQNYTRHIHTMCCVVYRSVIRFTPTGTTTLTKTTIEVLCIREEQGTNKQKLLSTISKWEV